MADVFTNAAKIARIYQARRNAWSAALRKALGTVLLTVENRAIKNLSGSGAPGSYPVPTPTGHLRRSMGSKLLGPTTGTVFNTAIYANAIHEGYHPYGNKRAKAIGPRPYLQDACDSTDAGLIIQTEMRPAVFQ